MPKPTTVKITVWYCHNCSSGPLNCKIDAYCPYCYHQKCSGCTTTTIRTPAGR
ncbi:hypothetical protein CABS03_08886 [Colletotrichum abscissum]|uniref:Uncharacterized protein n=1 Tax=Colletotrichum abscissum TaxID=1671311 RepID=A0A9Q0ATT9_9PEZI|nr:hypothetical protein CABS02_14098 [Colletotrichum abscissum]KAK1720621.1 hypothetical protein BDP67DRAFT_573407 [Colletotrichum lupini]